MRFDSLSQWLDWQLHLHVKAIDLGLDRVSEVAHRLHIKSIASKVITVAGTNGKGSSVACYENWLSSAGFSVASYTSPHLLSYNERIKLDTVPVDDALLCQAFEAVEAVRQGTALTYFEFGTLAAFWLMQKHQPDYAILEVGLGGRLDAVNIIDPDLIHLTSISIDHQNWLGDSREKIGFEKAGVLRPHVPVVCNDIQPPQSVLDEIERLDCPSLQYRRDFFIQEAQAADEYDWVGPDLHFSLTPPLPGKHQLQNLAGVVAGLSLLLPLNKYQPQSVADYFAGTHLAGRFQRLQTKLAADVYIDVGHNPDAARAIAENLVSIKNPAGRIVLLLGMLEDKQSLEFVVEFERVVDSWWLLSLDCDRGLSADALEQRITSRVRVAEKFEQAEIAVNTALSSLRNQDIMLVTGSFATVEFFLRAVS
ncbi:MAG: folylpolyglutamate synthase/dihydrofolate synthase family protein [Gammaproteobacteria bacterium]